MSNTVEKAKAKKPAKKQVKKTTKSVDATIEYVAKDLKKENHNESLEVLQPVEMEAGVDPYVQDSVVEYTEEELQIIEQLKELTDTVVEATRTSKDSVEVKPIKQTPWQKIKSWFKRK